MNHMVNRKTILTKFIIMSLDNPIFSLQDINEDQQANEEGRELGRRFPTAPAYEKLKHRMPKGFPERYKRR